MQFVSSDVVVKNAIAEGLVKQDDVWAIQSYLDAYDVALDGRLDHGFFNMQIRPDMYMTVNHPLSRDSAMAQRINRLISRTLSADEAQTTEPEPQSAAADDTLDSPLAIAAAIALSPLLIFGLISGCGGTKRSPEVPVIMCSDGRPAARPEEYLFSSRWVMPGEPGWTGICTRNQNERQIPNCNGEYMHWICVESIKVHPSDSNTSSGSSYHRSTREDGPGSGNRIDAPKGEHGTGHEGRQTHGRD